MQPLSRSALLVALLFAVFGGLGCHENGYRTLVYPGQEGQYETKRIKVEEPPPPPPAPPARPSDPDLAKLEDTWPSLSPADRKAVSDLAARLAAH